MVKGLALFKEHFRDYQDQYLLIGGTACYVQFTERELPFRVTKDLDIVLIVEAITDRFVRHFWDFVQAGGYKIAEVDGQKRFYRFIHPINDSYPKMLELFARKPEILPTAAGIHITDIPVGEDLSSLSAILMDDAYYHFTLANTNVIDGLRVANDRALIGLKARAFINNQRRKEEGQKVHKVDIVKHRDDVLGLAAVVNGEPATAVTDSIRSDISQFIDSLREGPYRKEEGIIKAWMELGTSD